ncbi:DNA-binding response regulator [Clostridium beijerinckii]|uniref:DNA-binding response regulator n=1 Tax=Clostridium beijerinckii TaxID=1520 RepID=UPI0015712D6D|nr:DNA-binding response regulator [Clostridium beijerinckii]NRT70022.1 DNA-binding CsgD family transcriptional regulator [Clostridium beijerinckii]
MNAKTSKNQIEELYLAGYNASQIAKKLKKNVEAVRKYIQRNLNHLKGKHNIALVERREVIRATNYEANKYMGDSTFIKKNRSIYKTKLDGDIVIDVNAAPIVSFDTPKRLKNENSLKEIDKRIRKSNYRKDKLFV